MKTLRQLTLAGIVLIAASVSAQAHEICRYERRDCRRPVIVRVPERRCEGRGRR
jgi:hypothetical protein